MQGATATSPMLPVTWRCRFRLLPARGHRVSAAESGRPAAVVPRRRT